MGVLVLLLSILLHFQEFKTILDINEEVYSWWDHGLLSAALHPEFPKEPYIFIAVRRAPATLIIDLLMLPDNEKSIRSHLSLELEKKYKVLPIS